MPGPRMGKWEGESGACATCEGMPWGHARSPWLPALTESERTMSTHHVVIRMPVWYEHTLERSHHICCAFLVQTMKLGECPFSTVQKNGSVFSVTRVTRVTRVRVPLNSTWKLPHVLRWERWAENESSPLFVIFLLQIWGVRGLAQIHQNVCLQPLIPPGNATSRSYPLLCTSASFCHKEQKTCP